MTLIALGVAGVILSLVVPALIPQSRLDPGLGIALSLTVMGVRALVTLTAALALLILLPGSAVFHAVTGWCLHAVVPFFSTHFGINGHRLGELATLLPLVGFALSLGIAATAIWRTGRAIGSWMRASGLGAGPGHSLVVCGDAVVVVAAGLLQPKVLISAGALAALDDDELRASLAHEHAHISRRHSYVSVVAALLHSLGWVLPLRGAALANLHFHLERDADEQAVRDRENPLALAAAICKAGRSVIAPSPLLAGLGVHAVPARVKLLLDRGSAKPSAAAMLLARSALVVGASSFLLLLSLDIEMGMHGISALAGSGGFPFCPG